MERDELQRRIDEFSRWQYRFEFEGGVRTPLVYEGLANRQEQRRRYFFEALLQVTGGSLAGRRVLDLGCNAGYWSLQAIEAGADYVLGIDGRRETIEQAQLVFDAKQVAPERYRFVAGNAFEHGVSEQFDVVLCLGFLDVTGRPLEVFDLIERAGAGLVVIDTAIIPVRAPYFELGVLSDPVNIVDRSVTLVPSREAVIELAEEYGFTPLALAPQIDDYDGLDDYRRGRRLAFICSKGAALAGLRAAPRTRLPWWAASRLRRRGG